MELGKKVIMKDFTQNTNFPLLQVAVKASKTTKTQTQWNEGILTREELNILGATYEEIDQDLTEFSMLPSVTDLIIAKICSENANTRVTDATYKVTNAIKENKEWYTQKAVKASKTKKRYQDASGTYNSWAKEVGMPNIYSRVALGNGKFHHWQDEKLDNVNKFVADFVDKKRVARQLLFSD